MRSKILTLALAGAAALAAASIALAGMMHPTLGAHLSGMGDHGIVNLQAHASKGQLCWKFELNVMHPTAATIRDKGGMIVARLGHMYSAKGCAHGGRSTRSRRSRRSPAPTGSGSRRPVIRATCAGSCSPAWRICRWTRRPSPDEKEAAPHRARRLPRHRRRRPLVAVVGEGRLGHGLGRRLAGRRRDRADPPAGGWRIYTVSGDMPVFEPATWRLQDRRHRRAAAGADLRPAARAAAGRAGLDLPLRDRLDGERRPLGRRPASRTSSPRPGRCRARTRWSSSRWRSRTSTT